jgi:RNA polymerase sigma-70 factor (ECF subfamily)
VDNGPGDAEVIERVLAGDVNAFELLVKRYERDSFMYAKYMTGNSDDAADVVQESFVRAFRALRRCNDRERFKGWLFRIVSNQCKTLLARRRRQRADPIEALVNEPAARENPGVEAEAADVRSKVLRALDRLSPEQREAFILRYVHGLEMDEIAKALDVSMPALKMRLKRGRDALRELLAAEGVTP